MKKGLEQGRVRVWEPRVWEERLLAVVLTKEGDGENVINIGAEEMLHTGRAEGFVPAFAPFLTCTSKTGCTVCPGGRGL